MSDQGFREIQLSSKQVVFLFMAGAVALVGTFLLGVSVGQGVGVTEPPAKPTPTAFVGDQTAPLPPATTAAPGSFQSTGDLQKKEEANSAKPVTPSPLPSPEPQTKPTPMPAATPAPAVKPAAPVVKPTPTPAPAATGDFYVNVDSFSDKGNAERQAAELKRKGFPAKVYTAPGSGARYKTRLGPFDRPTADAMIASLRKAGYKPSAPIR